MHGHVDANTFANYSYILNDYVVPVLGARRIKDLRPQHVSDLDRGLLERTRLRSGKLVPAPLGKSTRSAARARLRAVVHRAVADGLIGFDPFRSIASDPALRLLDDPLARQRADKRRPRFLSLEEVAAVCEGVDERWAPVVGLLAEFGLRKSEALGLTWDHVDLDTGVVTIAAGLVRIVEPGRSVRHELTATTKNGKDRVLPATMSPGLLATLRHWKATQGAERLAAGGLWQQPFGTDVNLVFTDQAGRNLTHDQLKSALRRVARRLRLERSSPHMLRYSMITHMHAAGVPDAQIAKISGHTDLNTLRIYTHSVASEATPAHAAYVARLRATPAPGETVVSMKQVAR
jgi:integrase